MNTPVLVRNLAIGCAGFFPLVLLIWLIAVFALPDRLSPVADKFLGRAVGLVAATYALSALVWAFKDAQRKESAIAPLHDAALSKWAVAAFYLGLSSILVIPAPIALLVSFMALLDIKKHRKQGLWRAMTGLVMGVAGTVVFLLFLS